MINIFDLSLFTYNYVVLFGISCNQYELSFIFILIENTYFGGYSY